MNLFFFEKEQDAKALIEALDTAGLDVRAAFWNLDGGRWKLWLALSEVREHGPKWVYAKLASHVQHLRNIDLSEITVVEPEHSFVQLLRKLIQTGPTITAIQLSDNTVNGHLIEDVLVHRVL